MNPYVFDQKIYRNNIKKNFSFPISIIIILIIILSGTVLYFKSCTPNKITYHFVEIDNFSTYSLAKECNNSLQQYNTTGYIYFDENYHILVGYYQTKKQAENVIEKLNKNFPKSKIFSLNFDRFSGKKNWTKPQNNVVFDLNDTIEDSIDNLNTLLNKYEKNEISQTVLYSNFSKLIDDFNSCKDNFFTHFSKPQYLNYRKQLENISTSLNKINSSITDNTISKIIRFETIQIIFYYHNFVSLF